MSKTAIPEIFTAGDTIDWLLTFADFSPADGWSVRVVFVNTAATVTVESTASGDGHQFTASASVTSGYTPGSYHWRALATKGGERETIAAGAATISPDFGSGPFDPRSHAQRVLDAIQSVIEGRASEDSLSLSIAGRSITKMTLDELIAARRTYRAEVADEKATAKVAAGLGGGSTAKIRFRG